jgi:hypothetical protein
MVIISYVYSTDHWSMRFQRASTGCCATLSPAFIVAVLRPVFIYLLQKKFYKTVPCHMLLFRGKFDGITHYWFADTQPKCQALLIGPSMLTSLQLKEILAWFVWVTDPCSIPCEWT